MSTTRRQSPAARAILDLCRGCRPAVRRVLTLARLAAPLLAILPSKVTTRTEATCSTG
jgi:hypothetical protein